MKNKEKQFFKAVSKYCLGLLERYDYKEDDIQRGMN